MIVFSIIHFACHRQLAMSPLLIPRWVLKGFENFLSAQFGSVNSSLQSKQVRTPRSPTLGVRLLSTAFEEMEMRIVFELLTVKHPTALSKQLVWRFWCIDAVAQAL